MTNGHLSLNFANLADFTIWRHIPKERRHLTLQVGNCSFGPLEAVLFICLLICSLHILSVATVNQTSLSLSTLTSGTSLHTWTSPDSTFP